MKFWVGYRSRTALPPSKHCLISVVRTVPSLSVETKTIPERTIMAMTVERSRKTLYKRR